MPLARTFFEAFERLPQAHQPWVHLHGLYGYLERYRGVDPLDFFRSGLDIEEFHSEVYEAALATLDIELTPECIVNFKAHHELIFLFAYVVNVIQNGPVSTFHAALAKELNDRDGVITFNWDTLMDRALSEETLWTVDTGYGVRPLRVFRNEWRESTNGLGSEIKLWKLHGSSNWITSHEQSEKGELILIQTRGADTLHVFEWATGPYACYRGRFMAGHGPFSYGYYPPNLMEDPGRSAGAKHMFARWQLKIPGVPEGTAEHDGLVSMPMIIPPVKRKFYNRFGGLFDTVWTGAKDLLARANTIIVLGYSFPRTDDRSLKLFTDAFLRRHTVPRVVIVDPAPQRAADVFRSLGIPDSHLSVHSEYLDGDSRIPKFL